MHIYEQLVELALAERESKNASVFLCVSVANGRPSLLGVPGRDRGSWG